MSKLFFTALLALAVASSAASVGEIVVEAEAQMEMPTSVRGYSPKCYIDYKKCCDVYKSKTCYKNKCENKKHCYQVYPKKTHHAPKKTYSYHKKGYRAVEDSAATEAGEVDASIKKFNHHKPETKCYYKQECKSVGYECGKIEHECSDQKHKACEHGICDHL